MEAAFAFVSLGYTLTPRDRGRAVTRASIEPYETHMM